MPLRRGLNTKKIRGNQRQGGECVFASQSGGFAGGDAEKTPAGDYLTSALGQESRLEVV
jgi:hypothetical protein